jgi:uncharacterized protein DUF3467
VTEEQPPPQQPSPPEGRVNITLPPDIAAGVYASYAHVWFDADVFTIDFAVRLQPPALSADEDSGTPIVVEQSQVVARVRIPPTQVWELARVLTQQLDQWEQATGRSASAGGHSGPEE